MYHCLRVRGRAVAGSLAVRLRQVGEVRSVTEGSYLGTMTCPGSHPLLVALPKTLQPHLQPSVCFMSCALQALSGCLD